jgi:hypothetical protein
MRWLKYGRGSRTFRRAEIMKFGIQPLKRVKEKTEEEERIRKDKIEAK